MPPPRGVTPETLATEAIEALAALDVDTTVDDAAFAEYERTGVAFAGEDVLAWLKSLRTDTPLPRPEARKLK